MTGGRRWAAVALTVLLGLGLPVSKADAVAVGTVVATIPSGIDPTGGMAFDPATARLYIAGLAQTTNERIVKVIDTTTNTIAATYLSDIDPTGRMAFDPSTARLYIAGRTPTTNEPIVKVVDTVGGSPIPNIPSGIDPTGGIVLNPGASRLYVAGLAQTTNERIVKVIDTSNGTVVATIPSGIDPTGGMAFNPATARLYIAGLAQTTNERIVEVIDTPASTGSAAGTVTDGGTVTSDPGNVGATPEVPVQTSIIAPSGVSGTLSITPQVTTTANPTGFSLFGVEIVLTGPVATATSPYEVAFTVDSTALGGLAPGDVQVFRNGVALAGCTDPTAAVPDPCIVSRGLAAGGGGDALVVVRTSHFSTWSLGRLSYQVTGPMQPVDAAPTVNTAKAGSAIPVKFGLGGDKGLDVFAYGYPKSGTATCGSAATDEIEHTVVADTSTLTYDVASGQYTYKWKTTTAMKGCRDLVLRFRDGSQLRTLFNLR